MPIRRSNEVSKTNNRHFNILQFLTAQKAGICDFRCKNLNNKLGTKNTNDNNNNNTNNNSNKTCTSKTIPCRKYHSGVFDIWLGRFICQWPIRLIFIWQDKCHVRFNYLVSRDLSTQQTVEGKVYSFRRLIFQTSRLGLELSSIIHTLVEECPLAHKLMFY